MNHQQKVHHPMKTNLHKMDDKMKTNSLKVLAKSHSPQLTIWALWDQAKSTSMSSWKRSSGEDTKTCLPLNVQWVIPSRVNTLLVAPSFFTMTNSFILNGVRSSVMNTPLYLGDDSRYFLKRKTSYSLFRKTNRTMICCFEPCLGLTGWQTLMSEELNGLDCQAVSALTRVSVLPSLAARSER